MFPPSYHPFLDGFCQVQRIHALPTCDSRPIAGYIAVAMEVEERDHGFPRDVYCLYNICVYKNLI